MKLILFTFLAAVAFGSTAYADSAADLQARFKERYPHLVELKQAGLVGEASTGYIEFVQAGGGDAARGSSCRRRTTTGPRLYKLIAAKDGTTPEQVAAVNATRRFEKAQPGEWLKGADGQWKKKGS